MSIRQKPTRTQAERREATHEALLEATITSLCELGYHGTTTSEITQRAGVSQGALFKHFPNKSALVAAAADRLFDELQSRFRVAFAEGGRARRSGGAAVRKLWELFCDERLRAAWVLYLEAAVDPELRAAMAPVVARDVANVTEIAAEIFPEIARSKAHVALLDTALLAMVGASIQRVVHLDPKRERAMLAQLEVLADTMFQAQTAPKPSARRVEA